MTFIRDSVLILGCGGLGHVAIPLARALGLRPIVISRTEAKRSAAIELGAEAFITTGPPSHSGSEDPLVQEIIRVVDAPFGGAGSGPGGVNIVLQTAPEEETLRRITGALAMVGTCSQRISRLKRVIRILKLSYLRSPTP